MRVVLFFASLACVAVMGLHAWRENLGAEWRPHQLEYASILAERSHANSADQPANGFDVKLRQVVLPDGSATDRCVTCHVALEDPEMRDEPEPLRTHPGTYLNDHPVERFGCTLCHDGQGLAINFADAAAYERNRFWEKPLLKAPFIEANCYRCHSEVMEEATPAYAFGKLIFDSSGCIGCHTVRGRGGAVGPDLSVVGDSSRHVKVPTSERHDLVEKFAGNETLAYLYESVRWPDAQPAVTKMPQFGFTDEEATALVVYLKSLVRPATVVGLLPPPRPVLPPTDPVERGRALYGRYCIGCHAEAGKGGIPNPNARNASIRPLNALARQMAFSGEDDVERFLSIVRGLNGTALEASDATALANWPAISETWSNARQAILGGLAVPKADATGPEPLGMPSWRHLIDEAQADVLIYYLLTVAPWTAAATGGGGQ